MPDDNNTYYLILDKTNKVVCDFKTEIEAQEYIKARPYLKYQKFEFTPLDTSDMVWS